MHKPSGVLNSHQNDLYQLYNGPEEFRPKIVEGAIKIVINIDVKLGETILIKDKAGKWEVISTEGGYGDFPVHDETEFKLLQYLQ